MVSINSIMAMIFTIIVSVVFPITLIIIMRLKYKASLKSFFIGALAFLIVVQFIEGPINYYMIAVNKDTSSIIMSNPFIYMLYGGLMAGIFEETARYICFKYILKKERRIQDGISYGIGQGGCEAILIVGITYISNLIVSIGINNGSVSKETIGTLYDQLVGIQSHIWLIGGVERLSAIIIQIGLSLLVFKAIKDNKKVYYLLAVLVHAVIDFPAALYQRGIINIFITEGLVIVSAVLFLIFIFTEIRSNKKDLIDIRQ